MSILHHIVELSPSSGETNEGHWAGRVDASLFQDSYSNAPFATTVYALRRDKSSGSTLYRDVSTVVVSGNTNAVEPWGSVTEMSTGDALIIACDAPVAEILLDIDRVGVGTWTGLEVYDSSNGTTFNRRLLGTSDAGSPDETNGLKTAGINRIRIPTPSPDSMSFSPAPEDITARRWLAIVPVGLTGAAGEVTTSPAIKNVYLKHRDAHVVFHQTAGAFNSALTNGTYQLPSAVLVSEDVQVRFVFPFIGYGIDWTIHRRNPDTFTMAHEYLASDGTWKALPNFTDAANDWKVGPAALGDPSQLLRARWTIPSDWASATQSMPNASGGTSSATGYWIRYRVTSVTQRVTTSPAAFRGRARAFGSGNVRGITERAATTINRVMFEEIGRQAGGAATLGVLNLHTGREATLALPNPIVIGDWYDITTPVAVAANAQWDLRHVSGGRIYDAYMRTE